MSIMAHASRKDAERLCELRKLIKGELIKICSAQYQAKLPARHGLKLDQPALRPLKRFANDDDAIKSLAELEKWCERKKRGSCWVAIVMACINAERLAREFARYLEQANKTLKRLGQPRKALDVLRGFLSDNRNKDWAMPWGNGAAMEHGLNLLDYGISTEESVAKEAFAQFGATRKMKIKTAPRDSAIWALADAVKLHTGKAHRREVATLASVILEMTIDESMVAHAVSERGPRFDTMQKKRAKRLFDSRLTGPNFEHIRKGRN